MDFQGLDFDGGFKEWEGPPIQTDMNKREREQYWATLMAGSRLLEMAATNIREEDDEYLIASLSMFNLFLMSAYQKLQAIIMETVDKSIEVEATIKAEAGKIGDHVPEGWEK